MPLDPFSRIDPFTRRDPFGSNPFGGDGPGRQPARFPAYSPEEAAPLQKALQVGTSTLGYISSTLGKAFGGRAIRGALAGDSKELLSAIPFSDTLGITDPKNEHSMDEVLQKHGIVRPNDPTKWELRDFVVPAADIAADPGTYLFNGPKHALNAAGLMAKKAGALGGEAAHLWTRRAMIEGFQESADDLLAKGGQAALDHATHQGRRIVPSGLNIKPGEPLGARIGIGNPFSDAPLATFGTGDWSKAIEGGFDFLGDKLKYAPGIRGLRQALDSRAGRFASPEAQRAAEQYGYPAKQAMDATNRREHFQRAALAQPFIDKPEEAQFLDTARQMTEGVPIHNPLNVPEAPMLAGMARGQLDSQLAMKQGLGLPTKDASSFLAQYAPRQAEKASEANVGARAEIKSLPMKGSSDKKRNEVLRNVVGGQTQVDRYYQDPRFSGAARTLQNKAAEDQLWMHQVDMLNRQYPNALTMPSEVNEFIKNKLPTNVGKLNKMLKKAGPEYVADQKGLYSRNLVGDMERYGQETARQVQSAKTIYGAIGDNSAAGTPGMNVWDFGKKLGLKSGMVDPTNKLGLTGFGEHAYKALAKQGFPQYDPTMPARDAIRALKGVSVPQALANELAGGFQKGQMPEELIGPMKHVASFTNAFRGLTYGSWLASHMRNLGSGGYTNLHTGTGFRDYRDLIRVMRGQAPVHAIPGMPTGLTPEQSVNWTRQQLYTHGNVFGGGNESSSIVGQLPAGTPNTGGISPVLPGMGAVGPKGNIAGDALHLLLQEGAIPTAKGAINKVLHPVSGASPFPIQGVGAATQDFPWLAAGKQVGNHFENVLRGASMLGMVRKGYSWEEAARMMNKGHFDYGDLSHFERTVMKPTIPFYTYMRKNLPLHMDYLMHQPGKISVPTKLAANANGDTYTPDYMMGGVHIPFGQPQPGTQRYIAKLGLPFEEAFERMKFKNFQMPGGRQVALPNLAGTAAAYLGSANPLVKAPIEQITDTQLHTGRKLSDLDSWLERSLGVPRAIAQPVEQAIANSPATRIATTARQATDPRKDALAKAMNFLTGIKTTDVDIERTQSLEQRRAAESLLKTYPGVRRYEDLYLSPDYKGPIDPRMAELFRLDAYYKKQAAAQAKARKAAAAQSP